MARFALGAIVTLAALGLAAVSVIATGSFDTRASTPHHPLMAWAVHTTLIRAAQRGGARVRPPRSFTVAQTEAGFRLYDRDCASCHGGPGIPRSPWADGMNPSPPYLLDAARHWRPGELYWIVGNGVKMTGMPAWRPRRSDDELWDIVAFLEAMPFVTATDYALMRRTQFPAMSPPPRGCPTPRAR
jgi:mono/diheme cytochrome c family protein